MLILASKSPRRSEILTMSGISFKVVVKDVEENVIEDNPALYALKTAKKKALAVLNDYPEELVLSADTVVTIDNLILEKPRNIDDARKMIKIISGKEHKVITGVFLGNNKKSESFFVETKVYVSELTDDEIEEYINTKEPYDKAGGYAVQGIFGKYIEKIDGDYYNVVGLPINTIIKKLKILN